MASVPASLLVAALLLVPPASLVGVVLWARSLKRTQRAPKFAAHVAYGVAVVGVLAIVGGLGLGFSSSTSAVTGDTVQPSEKARHLAEAISDAMNCEAFGVLLSGIAAGWLLFWRWRARAGSGRPMP
jgi:hypothetical protein